LLTTYSVRYYLNELNSSYVKLNLPNRDLFENSSLTINSISQKKVTFNDSQLLEIEIPDTSSPKTTRPKDIKKGWYTQEDYEYFTIERHYRSVRIRSIGKDHLLDRVLTSHGGALINIMTVQMNLLEWTVLEVCQGLEMKINYLHRYQRLEEQKRALFAVLKIQACTRGKTKCKDYGEELRESSEKHADSAKIFARAIAKADERAVELELRAPKIANKISLLRRMISKRNRSIHA
jgi:hypothetical protein